MESQKLARQGNTTLIYVLNAFELYARLCSILIRWFETGLIRMIMIHLYLMTQPKMILSCVPLHLRVFLFFFFKFCLLLVSDLDIEVFPYITTNFSMYLLLVLLSLPLSLLFISTTPAYIVDKTLVLKNISNST